MNRKTLFTAVAGLVLAAGTALAQSKPTIAILTFNNSALGKANEELAPLGKGIADIMINDLASNTNLRVVERDQIAKILEEQGLTKSGAADAATAVKVGKLLGAHHMVAGGFITDRAAGTMRINIRVFKVETGEIEWTGDVRGTTANLLALIDQAADKTNKGLKLPDIPAQAREEHAAAVKKQEKVPFQAVMLYSRALDEKDNGNKTKAVELFKESLKAFPDFDKPKEELKKLGQ